jgi:predicted DNA-binding transcriptional regulator YafY
MNLIERITQIERLDCLIRRKATGSPRNLSTRMGVSERQVYNIINDMKDMGAPIFYCPLNQSYCYDREVKFKFGFLVHGEEEYLRNLKGGRGPEMFLGCVEWEPVMLTLCSPEAAAR